MFQLNISHAVNGHLGLVTFRTGHYQSRMFRTPFVGSITSKTNKYHSSVQHVSLEVRVIYLIEKIKGKSETSYFEKRHVRNVLVQNDQPEMSESETSPSRNGISVYAGHQP